MATINPDGIPKVRTLGSMSPLKAPAPPPPPTEPMVPQEKVELQAPKQTHAAEKKSPPPPSKWLRNGTLALVGLGAVAGGALVGGVMTAGRGSAPTPQVQTQSPARLTQEQSQTLELQSARFGVAPTVRSFDGAPVRVDTDKHEESKDGIPHEISIDRLMRSDGQALYSSETAELATLDFHDQADEDGWATTSTLAPAGNLGKYVSVSESTTVFRGGSSSSQETQLRTIDTETGKVVNLSELLSPELYGQIAGRVQSGLDSLQGMPYQAEDAETLDSYMNNGFALSQTKDGKTQLTVAIPGQGGVRGSVAEFTFLLPANALQ